MKPITEKQSDMETRKRIGERIKFARRGMKMTQTQLAKAVGKKSAAYIAFIEQGERNINIVSLLKICSVIGIDVSYIHLPDVDFMNGDTQPMKLHKKDDTYILTDSCYWHDHEQDKHGRAVHETEVVNLRTGGVKNLKCGTHIKIIQ